jgi:hypothetical protein
MIKQPTPEQLETLTLNVYLKDGREFLGCDTTSKPFGETESVVAFWQDGSLRLVPISQVREVAMLFA